MANYEAKLGDRTLGKGTFQEVKAVVAGEITERLADDPEGMAQAAQEVNSEMAAGTAQATADARGMWAAQLPGGDLLRIRRAGS